MKIILFEDEKVSNFYPISRLRTIDEIRTGRWTQKERVSLQFKIKPQSYSLREYYGDDIKIEGDTLFLNARLKDFSFFSELDINTCVVNKDGDILGYRSDRIIENDKFDGFNVITKEIPLYNFIWEVIADLHGKLTEDLERDASLGKIFSPINNFVHIRNKKNVYIGNNVHLGEGVVLSSEAAPIWIDDDVTIESHSFVKGPVYIGKGSKIKPGSILDVVALGKVVKLCGEIEETVFQGYSNKQHLGFLGHAFIGKWVNLGAGTTNSDLKNNYSKVRVILEGKSYETGMQFLGTIIGDHTKAAINTTFNTGTIVEPFCNIFGRTYPPKYIPPFIWWGGENFAEYKLDKAIETAVNVMRRRDKNLDENYKKRIEKLFSETKTIRKEIK
jgi:UDP-N-acetylglucosamine diphosphorylase/glucosamine-1-phosphate N-acetyltransferase